MKHKITAKLMAALLLPASGTAVASSCLDTRLIMKVELAAQESMLDTCLEKKGKTCKVAAEYFLSKNEYLQSLTSRYLVCNVEITVADPDEARLIKNMMNSVSGKIDRLSDLVKKTGGKF